MRDKRQLTRVLVEQLSGEYGLDESSAYNTWWYNLRSGGGLRLTLLGYTALSDYLKLEHYRYKLEPFTLNSKMVIELDRKLNSPYYIESVKRMPTELVFFGSKEAMLANLYGDLQKFLDSFK